MTGQGIVFDPSMLLAEPRGHSRHIGLRYHAHGEDWCELALPYDERLIGNAETGVLASGPILTLMDSATCVGMYLKLGMLRPCATLDLRIDYLRPARIGSTVIGHGECYRISRVIAFVRGYAHDGDPEDPVAHVAGTFMFTDTQP
ncbi:MAG: PaaI family thioesterase [Novosphingobium sp.]|nr:PaaI family thioesterase [Novosphingobium sp.]